MIYACVTRRVYGRSPRWHLCTVYIYNIYQTLPGLFRGFCAWDLTFSVISVLATKFQFQVKVISAAVTNFMFEFVHFASRASSGSCSGLLLE